MRTKRIIQITLLLICILVFGVKTFASNVRLELTYGIDNQAKAGRKLPVEMIIENKDKTDFKGKIKASMYYEESSYVEYEYPINIDAESIIYKNINLSLGSNVNTLLVQLCNENDKVINEEQLNIDMQSLDSDIIIGVLSDAPWKMDYFNNVLLDDGNIKTKLVNIEKRKLQRNPSLLDTVDVLIVSDVNTKNFPSDLDNTIYSFINKGNVVILGTGGHGINAIPNIFEKYLVSPVFVNEEEIEIYPNVNNADDTIKTKLKICYYNFEENTPVFDTNGISILRTKSIGTGILANATFAFGDLRDYAKTNSYFAKDIIQKSLGNSRLLKYSGKSENKYVSISDEIIQLMNIVDASMLPNMKILMLVAVSYAALTLLLTVFCQINIQSKKYYPYGIVFLSIVFTICIPIIFASSRKEKNFATYVKIVDIADVSNQETMYVTTRSPYEYNYNMHTDLSNAVYAVIDNVSGRKNLIDDIKNNKLNKTKISSMDNGKQITVNNLSTFVPTYLSIENNNVNTNLYKIDYKINLFDNKLSGYISNDTDINFEDLNILFYGGIVKIGPLNAHSKVTLSEYSFTYMPTQNTYQTAENMCLYPKNKIVKAYLDSNIHGYYDNAKLICFADSQLLYPLESTDIKEVNGMVLLSKTVDVDRSKDNIIENTSLKHEIKNINGEYNFLNNTISGDTPCENEYFFNIYGKIEKIAFENIVKSDIFNLDYFVPFEGNIFLYNNQNGSYDLVNKKEYNATELKQYLSPADSIRVRFESRTQDTFNRRIYLPIIRAQQRKNK